MSESKSVFEIIRQFHCTPWPDAADDDDPDYKETSRELLAHTERVLEEHRKNIREFEEAKRAGTLRGSRR